MKHDFIVIEGVDGVGKTTAGQKLAKVLNGVFYQTPSSFWRKYRLIVENSPALVRFTYYLLATCFSSKEIGKILEKKSVICDRYIYSTWAHHYAYGLKILKHISFDWLPIERPSRVIYLYVNQGERERRIALRNNNNKKDRDSYTLLKAHNFFMSIKDEKIVKIDCSFFSEEEVIRTIIKVLKM